MHNDRWLAPFLFDSSLIFTMTDCKCTILMRNDPIIHLAITYSTHQCGKLSLLKPRIYISIWSKEQFLTKKKIITITVFDKHNRFVNKPNFKIPIEYSGNRKMKSSVLISCKNIRLIYSVDVNLYTKDDVYIQTMFVGKNLTAT